MDSDGVAVKLGILILFFLSSRAYGFVENITHGYSSCVACHIAPAGGGVLTDYGRSLSRELMSTWGADGIEKPLFGALENRESIKWGGDVRTLQTYLDNSRTRQGKLFLMQQNLELAVKMKRAWIVGSAGTQEGPSEVSRKGQFLSERHFVLWELNDQSRLRVGKFRANFGIYDPNHTRVNKSPLGFGSNSETYNLEFSQIEDEDQIFVTAGLGRLDLPRDKDSERNLSVTYARNFNGDAQAGGSFLVGESEIQRRSLAGAFFVSPLTEKGVLKSEIDFQRSEQRSQGSVKNDLFAAVISAGYAPVKGLRPYLFFEYLQRDLANKKTRQNSPGFGVQWLPVPHLELQAEFKHQTLESSPDHPNESGWFLFHFYL